MKEPVALDIPPGVVSIGTDEIASGRWRDANQVRWENGVLQPIGGWAKAFDTVLSGVPRSMLSWRSDVMDRYTAIGTHTHLYAWRGSTVSDITPAGLTAGRPYSVPGLGYGAGPYGRGKYGRRRTGSTSLLEARVWSLETWGQELIACPNDTGTIYKWNLVASTAAVLTGAPTARGVMRTDEDHLVAFAADGNPRLIKWCKRADLTTWAPSSDPLNNAGDKLLNTGGVYRAHAKVRGGYLVLTDRDAHIMSFVGSPFVYGVQKIADGCGCLGPGAIAVAGDIAYWVSANGFWMYDGVVKPVPCTIEDQIPKNTRRLNDAEVCCGVNLSRGEVWWFYTNTQGQRRYAIYSYKRGWWSCGALDRTTWVYFSGDDRPVAATPGGVVYQHEFGWLADGATRAADVWAQTAPLKIGNGAQAANVSMFMSDTIELPEGFRLDVMVRDKPNSTPIAKGPYTFTRPDGGADVRFQGRRVEIKVQGVSDVGWQMGPLHALIGLGSRRG